MSDNVTVKEEPREFEESCSPFDLLNDLALADTTQNLIKYETDGLVKTEITVGEQNDEDCALITSDNVPSDVSSNVPSDVPSNVPSNVPSDTSRSKHNSSSSSLYKELLLLGPKRRSKRSRKDPKDNSSGFKMKLPSKYKILFDAVLAFPEMSKDILPIIEELIHFHNCTCLLRSDMNLCRCEDCGKGFGTPNGLKTHSRYCVLLRIEKRFGPANIEKHIGEAPEPFPPPIPGPTPEKVIKPKMPPIPLKIEPVEAESQIPELIMQEDSDEDCKPNQSPCYSEVEEDPDFLPNKKPKSNPSTPKRSAKNKQKDPSKSKMLLKQKLLEKEKLVQKEKRACRVTAKALQMEDRQYVKGTCWPSLVKSHCYRDSGPAAGPRANKIIPYDVFCNRGDAVYHNPIPIPINGLPSTAQNVYNTMICDYNQRKLLPLEAGRKNYRCDVPKNEKEYPSLFSYPLSSADELAALATITTLKPKLRDKPGNVQKDKAPKRKIRVSCLPRKDKLPATTSWLPVPRAREVPSAFGMNSRRTKSLATPPPSNQNIVKTGQKKNTFELVFEKGKKTAAFPSPSTVHFAAASSSEFDPPTDPFAPNNAGRNSHTGHSDWLKGKLTEYLAETSSTENYGLEEHTLLFVRTFLAGKFPLFNASVKKTAEKILQAFQDTIPVNNEVKKKILQECRSKVLPVVYLGERECIKKYGVEVETFNFLDSFAFGIANPSYKDINRAENLLRYIEVRKLRENLRKEMSKNRAYFNSLPVNSRIVIGDFVERVRPDKVSDSDFKLLEDVLKKSSYLSEYTFDGGAGAGPSLEILDGEFLEGVLEEESIPEEESLPEQQLPRRIQLPKRTRKTYESTRKTYDPVLCAGPRQYEPPVHDPPGIKTGWDPQFPQGPHAVILDEDDLSSPETMRCAPKSPEITTEKLPEITTEKLPEITTEKLPEITTHDPQSHFQRLLYTATSESDFVDHVYPENPTQILNAVGLKTNDTTTSDNDYPENPIIRILNTVGLKTNDTLKEAVSTWSDPDFLRTFITSAMTLPSFTSRLDIKDRALLEMFVCSTSGVSKETCNLIWEIFVKCGVEEDKWIKDTAKPPVTHDDKQEEEEEEPATNELCDLNVDNNERCSASKQLLRIGVAGHGKRRNLQLNHQLTVCIKCMTKDVMYMPKPFFENLVKSSPSYMKLLGYMERKLAKPAKPGPTIITTTTADPPTIITTTTADQETQFDTFHHRKRSYIGRYEEFNFEAQDKLDSLVKQGDSLKWKVNDLEQQLETEKHIRQFFKSDMQAAGPASKKRTLLQLETELKSAQAEIRKLRQSQSSSKTVDSLKSENTKLKDLKQTLQHTIQTKCDEICSLEGSIQSVSEALRHQTKTISTLSRKHYDDLVEEHNHRIYTGFESLVSVTCKILGNRLAQDNKKIEDPAEMRQLCQDLSGEENLFSIFTKVFCGNADCGGEEEAAAIEKRVLFLINLISYFYNGGIEDAEDDEPSSSHLQELL